ncbi:DNA polymerase III subunit gamma/tau [Martelella alba]|uniref:DNA polymerase III subunit gamma/tau n=1 Tax=Martelella alba TaxID=2590451 RepID=A0ABY2SKV0_9HYPH|nr:DNA polymerase III subunit gamma/tau [Martelella alba]TKI06256.1 DNA polymerase III subunit gamma/tau [Martelella alba]
MSYQVLARKWRPQTFSDVVGQEHVLTALTNGLSMGRIHHAYLLSGTRGVGKTTIARLLAKGLNCETGVTASPCGVCDNCREIEQGRFVDLIEIDAASRTKVEDTRDLLDNVQYAPARGRFKVYLIDEVHMLSRHSFNALLKTLEEPPSHVKFLLATTDPQKLPVTILSRCLQFHLKALDVGQIRGQLEYILQRENIGYEPRALQLLSRAADGSLRDALSLTDQAIAMGGGQVSAQTVGDMLGALNTEQPLALIEALAAADGNAMMAQLAECVARGADWEMLLVEMLTLLHRIAMGQLLPDMLAEDDDAAVASRLRELAKRIPPADLQLYYQTLLVGRKELPYAPDRRMGVEMTLLRGLAFHPRSGAAPSDGGGGKKTVPGDRRRQEGAASGETSPVNGASSPRAPAFVSPSSSRTAAPDKQGSRGGQHSVPVFVSPGHSAAISGNPSLGAAPAPVSKGDAGDYPDLSAQLDDETAYAYALADDAGEPGTGGVPLSPGPAVVNGADALPADLPNSTAQLLQARNALLRHSEQQKSQATRPVSAPTRQKPGNGALERLAAVTEEAQHRRPALERQSNADNEAKPEAYRWKASVEPEPNEPVATPKALRTALEHEKTPELALRLAAEAILRDPWAAQVDRLALPKLVQQLALNAFREDVAPGKIRLHLRSGQQHLNSSSSRDALTSALGADLGAPVELTVVADDNPAVRTPLEWRQAIYEEKLQQARQAIIADTHIQTLQRFFDAELDEDSIRPV